MKEVQLGNADYAVMPIENSSAGAVIDMYDLLTRYDNYIVAETFLPVEHALLSVPGAKLSDIKTVFSHPQALMQCSQFLNDNGFKQISVENTAVAAKRVVEEGDKTQAAVASEIAGKPVRPGAVEAGYPEQPGQYDPLYHSGKPQGLPEECRKDQPLL